MTRLTVQEIVKRQISGWAKVSTLGFAGVFAITLLARHHWAFDLVSHFQFQYVIGGLVLSSVLALFRKWFFCTAALSLTLGCFLVICWNVDFVIGKSKQEPQFTVVQYNRLFLNFNHDNLKNWLIENKENFDVVVLQEANARLAKMAWEIQTFYPYHILNPEDGAFGTVILSQIPFLETEEISLEGPLFTNIMIRALVQPPGFNDPISIYVLHALPPMDREEQSQRNFELNQTSMSVAKDKNTHRIMMGDWNITPYSPYFRDILKTSGLKKKSRYIVPLPTWPSSGLPWLFQIPIEHILSSPSLFLVKEGRYHSMGSDHQPLIATFAPIQ